MRNFCSLADGRYLPQLLCLYESLKKHSGEPFMLYVLPVDEECSQALESLGLTNVTLIDTELFLETMRLYNVRINRTYQEWCWSLASQLCEFLIDAGVSEVTYCDSDVFFFSDPAPTFDEIGSKPIAITPHRLIPSKQYLVVNGIYNVGFVHFKNTRAGRECLAKWAANVRERCSSLVGCGDQKYLDQFPEDFPNDCHIIQHIGVNAGPWSLSNWQVTEGPRLDGVPLIAYHFHEYIHGKRLTNYRLRDEDREFIYKPYIQAVEAAKERIDSAVHLQTI